MSLEDLTPGTWTVDPAHDEVGFTARHMMVTKVRGTFADVAAEVVVGAADRDLDRHRRGADGLGQHP